MHLMFWLNLGCSMLLKVIQNTFFYLVGVEFVVIFSPRGFPYERDDHLATPKIGSTFITNLCFQGELFDGL